MKIEKLHIYGFGKHENIQIHLKPGMNVLYGVNEAGKSSIQQFILHVLFGFPQKNAQLLRYEPKSGATYGGQIQLVDERMGRVVIERVKGKASGDVTVFFENGTRGGEKELATLLHAYTRSDFEAIFSFSLLQLQGFEKMTEDELTRTLLSSGTTGIDTLSKLEGQFVKEMGELFKPGGKKPVINKKIEELRALETEWKLYVEEVNNYEPSINRLVEIESLLETITEQEKITREGVQRYTLWTQLKPLKEKQLEIASALEKVQHINFPTDGIRRYETLKEKATHVNIANDQISETIKTLTTSNEIMTEDELDSLHSFLGYETEWHQLKAKRGQIEEEQMKTLQNQMQQIALVGIDWEKNLDKLVNADVSIQQEEKLVVLLKKREQLAIDILQENRLLEMKAEDLRLKKTQILERKQAENSSNKNKSVGIAFVFSSIMFVLGLVLSLVLSNWVIGITAFIASIIIFIGYRFAEQSLQRTNDIHTYEQLVIKEQEALQQQMKQLQNGIEMLEHEIENNDRHIQLFLANYPLSQETSASVLNELFSRLRIIQEQQLQLDQMEKKIMEVRNRMEQLVQQAKTIVKIPLVEDMLFHQLRELYSIEKKKREENETVRKKENELKETQRENRILLEVYANGVQTLFQEANVEKESDFYTTYHLFEQKKGLEKELQQLELQLGNREIGLEDFESEFEKKSNEKLQAFQRRRNELVDEKASLQHKTNILLKDDQQSVLLQKLEQKKAELQEYMKKWAAFKAIVEAMKQLMIQLKEERLPEVLETAQTYFKTLTHGSYEQFVLAPEGYFEAVKANGQRFHIAELSQATKEQAYLSLRIALALSLKRKAPFPLIMDDPFVHFDRFRLQQVVQLMKELQKEQQLLYFTCHENMQYVWQDVNVIQVGTLLAGSGGIVK